MTDVRKIQTTSGVPEPPPKKEATSAEPDKFKDLMKVDKIDPEEQKKRKRREGEETEEDVLADSLMLESLLQPQPQPSTATPTLKIAPAAPSEQPLPPSTAPLPSEQLEPHETENKEPQEHKEITPKKEPVPTAKVQAHESVASLPPTDIEEKIPIQAKEPFSLPAPIREATSAAPHLHMPSAPQKKKEEKHEEEPIPIDELPPVPPPTQAPIKKEEKPAPIEETAPAPPQVPLLQPAALPPPPPPPLIHTTLPHEVFTLFQRAVDVITVMTLTGVKETTISLQGPQFASSVFFGAEIIIQEFSTAPGSFNIQILGTQQAVALFDKHIDPLMRAFQTGEYTFRVNRLEARLKPVEEPLFKRKEKIEQDKTKDEQENP